ncbi:MAG: hypothetical protein HHJ12_07960 [Glaciimonas sp.]|nr:hypothetical protein [Glaciimonas sp.]
MLKKSPLEYMTELTLRQAAKKISDCADVSDALDLLHKAINDGKLEAELVLHNHLPAMVNWDKMKFDFIEEIRSQKIKQAQIDELERQHPSGSIDDDASTVANVVLQKWIDSLNGTAPPGVSADTRLVSKPQADGKTTKHKLRTNSLDVPIDKAIGQANSLKTAAVFLKLKELAISGELPFTGLVDGDALCYTNKHDKPDKLTWNGLDHRLRPGRKAAVSRE